MTQYLSDNYLPEIITYARQAQSAWLFMEPDAIDHVLTAVLDGLLPVCSDLARASVEETRMGVFEDKLLCLHRTISDLRQQYLPYHPQHPVHLSRLNRQSRRQPAGIIAGITDNLQPAAEVIFFSILAIRTRNPIIFSFHPSACSCAAAAASTIRDLAISAGAPDNCIQWLEESTPDMREHLLRHPDIAAMTASDMPSAVQNYLGIFKKTRIFTFPSNAFCYIHQSADLSHAARQLILSRTFDNGLLNCTEQIVCIDQSVYTRFRQILQKEGCYLASSEEITRLTAVLADLSSDTVNPAVMGQSPQTIAAMADITIPDATRLIALEMPLDKADHPLLIPFLCPVVVLMPVEQYEQAMEKIQELSTANNNFSIDLLLPDLPKLPQLRHLVIDAGDPQILSAISLSLSDFTLIKNAPAAARSLTSQYMNLYGSQMDAADLEQLLTHNRSQNTLPDRPHTFHLPSVVHFGKGALQHLQFTDNQTQIAILCSDLHTVSSASSVITTQIQQMYPTLKYYFLYVPENISAENAADYLLSQMTKIAPDCLVAIGNARIMETAKMLLSHYQPHRTSCRTSLILIPSIDGCHTAMLPFYGCYMPKKDRIDYLNMPIQAQTLLADNRLYASDDDTVPVFSFLAAMCDAFDAWLSNHSDDLTDALSIQAICLFLKWLPSLYDDTVPDDICIEHLRNACLLSGMAAAHTGIALSRIMAGCLHCAFKIPMNHLQAILLPHLIQYNGDLHPAKLAWDMPVSGLTVSDKLQQLYQAAGLCSTPSAAISEPDIARILAEKIKDILRLSDTACSIKACGIREKDYSLHIDILARQTFDQISTICADTNPRYPLLKELIQLYKQLYD